MRKILTVLFACLFAVLCLSACGKGVQKPDPSPSQSEEAAAVELLIAGCLRQEFRAKDCISLQRNALTL